MVKAYEGKIDQYTRKAADYMRSLSDLYKSMGTFGRRQLIDCLFERELIFDGDYFHPTELNEAVRILYNKDFAFSHKP